MIDFLLGALFWSAVLGAVVVGGAFGISALVMLLAGKQRKICTTEMLTYWLLERKQLGDDGRVRYYGGMQEEGGYTLTADAFKAQRWYTREEARWARDQFIMPAHRDWFKPTEHIFTEPGISRRVTLWGRIKARLML